MEREYISYKMGYCAKCGSNEIEYNNNEIDGNEVHFYYTCSKCGGAGCETYILDFECNTVIAEE